MPPELEIGEPLWWVKRLDDRLAKRKPKLKLYEDYYGGVHDLAFATTKFLEAFGGLFGEFADNWCELVVDAVEERLNVEGFRFGDDPKGDEDAWRIWQENALDLESHLAHVEALIKGEAYGLVWTDRTQEFPEITIEDPTQVIVEHEPGSRRHRAAALKRWRDDWDGREFATLYLPDAIYKYQTPPRGEWSGELVPTKWDERRVRGEKYPLPNPLGVVPVVPLINRPRLTVPGRSEIASVIPIQDATNKLLMDMLVASEFGAFRQRWATGMEIPIDPETNQPVEDPRAAISRVWKAESTDTKFGEFEATDLRNFVVGIEMLVQHIASQTRTPPHYFYLKGSFPSGEAIKSAETGLVAKAMRKMRSFEEGWEEIIRLAFGVMDDPRSKEMSAQTIWGDPESRSESEHIDAVLKRQALEVPREQLWEDAGDSPQQIERFKSMTQPTAATAVASQGGRDAPGPNTDPGFQPGPDA